MKINFIKHNIFSPKFEQANCGSNDTLKNNKTNDAAQNSFMNELFIMQNYNMPFLGRTTARPIYAIDRNMKATRFDSANKAGVALEIATPRILKCLREDESKRAKYAGDYCFALAFDVETTNEDGTVDIDKDKIKEIFETAEIARTEGANVKKRRFYGMNKEHKPVEFSSYSEAEKITSASRPNIIKCLNGKSKTACGYIFFNPEEIETADKTGKTSFDEEKLNLLIKRTDDYLSNPYIAEKLPLYAIYIGDDDKDDIRFDTITEAINELKISHRSINACLKGDSEFSGDYCFVRASDVESTHKDGTVETDKEKINELKNNAIIARNKDTCIRGKAVYAFKIDNSILERYDISAEAADALKISRPGISRCIAGKQKWVDGYIFIPAFKIEIRDKNGDLVVDKAKLKIEMEKLDENITAYKQQKTAEPKNAENEPAHDSREKRIVKLTPDSNQTITIIMPEKTKTAQKSEKTSSKNTEKTQKSKPSKTTNTKPKTTKTKTTTKTDKPKKKKKPMDPEKLKNEAYLMGAIYAFKSNGDYLEFKDLFAASKALETDPESLYIIIKKNTTSYKGYLFSTDLDY